MADCCAGLREELAALKAELIRANTEFQKTNQRLGVLEGKVAGLKGDIDNLKNNQGNNQQKPQDLTAIYQRLAKLESYCDSVEEVLEKIASLIKPITAVFKR